MKKSIGTDKHRLERIILHITELKDCLADFNIDTANKLENSKYAKYVITQLITNIYELSVNLQSATFQKLNELSQIELSVARNIASHDYVKVNFKIIYSICLQLIAETVTIELKTLLEEIEDGTYQ